MNDIICMAFPLSYAALKCDNRLLSPTLCLSDFHHMQHVHFSRVTDARGAEVMWQRWSGVTAGLTQRPTNEQPPISNSAFHKDQITDKRRTTRLIHNVGLCDARTLENPKAHRHRHTLQWTSGKCWVYCTVHQSSKFSTSPCGHNQLFSVPGLM